MKRLLSAALALAMLMSLAACSDEGSSSQEVSGKDASDFDRISDEEELKARQRSIETDGKFVYDDDAILTTAEFDSLNSYTAWFAKAFKMNAAIVLTNDIGKSSPEEYAKKIYNDNYKGDGVLFLINNDTNTDCFYRAGRTAEYISDAKVDMLFGEVSPMLALGDYNAAAERVLEEAELSLPEYFTDRTGGLDRDDILKYNEILKEASGSSTLNIYYVLGTGSEKMKSFAENRFKKFFDEGSDTAFLVIDGENGENYLCASGKYSFMLDDSDKLNAEIKALYTKKNGVKLERACEVFAEYSSEQ